MGGGGVGKGWGKGDDFARRPRTSWRDEEGDVRFTQLRSAEERHERPTVILLRLSLPFTSRFYSDSFHLLMDDVTSVPSAPRSRSLSKVPY